MNVDPSYARAHMLWDICFVGHGAESIVVEISSGEAHSDIGGAAQPSVHD